MNEFQAYLSQETAKAVVDIGKSVVEPSAKVIGESLASFLEGTLGWIGYFGETQKLKQNYNLERFKENLNSNLQSIPEENIREPLMSIVGPAIESSKFYYEEEYYRKMFSKLIAASCDKSKINDVHPSYVEIIKQLSPLDAKFLEMFTYYNTYPIAQISIIDQENKVTPCPNYLFNFKDNNNKFDFDEILLLTATLENLIRLGIVIKNSSVYELNYDYEQFRTNTIYKAFALTKENEGDKIRITKYRLELTNFGRNFINICLKNK